MSTTEDHNKAALRKFYEKKDPNRVKNVDPLFLRFEEPDILYFVEHKYGETVEGWIANSPEESPRNTLSSPMVSDGRKSGFFGSAKNLLSVGSRKSLVKSTGKSSMAESRTRMDSEDSDAGGVRPASLSMLPPPSPVVASGINKTLAEVKLDGAQAASASQPTQTSDHDSPGPVPLETASSSSPTTTAVEPAMSTEDVDAKIEEIKARELQALEEAREAERRIQEKLAKGREAIERARRELEDKEKELQELKKRMDHEARAEAMQNAQSSKEGAAAPTAAVIASSEASKAAVEVMKKVQAEVEMKQIETIAQLEVVERERIELEEQKQLAKMEGDERQAKILLIEAVAGGGEASNTSDETGGEDVVGDLPSIVPNDDGGSIMESPPKRVTLYERKLQAALTAPTASTSSPQGDQDQSDQPVSSSGRKTLLGGLVGRFTMTGKRKTVAPPQEPPPAPIPEPIPEVVTSEPEPVVSETAPVAAPAPLIAPPVTIVKDLAQDELEQWKLRALEAETRSKKLQMEAEERARKFQDEAEERIKRLEKLAAAAFERQAAPASAVVAPAAAIATPVPAAASGGVVSEINGYKLYPKDHADMGKYQKMQKAGLPQGAVENAMLREGIHPKSLYDDPMNNPAPLKKPAPVAAASPAPVASAGGDDGGFKRLPQDSPDLEKYRKMQKAGLPQGAIENALMRDMIHPKSLYGDSAINDPKPPPKKATPPAAAPSAGGGGGEEYKRLPQDSPDLEKYKKMQKAGLPQGAIENSMMRDFVHPKSLYGDNAINDPKPKPGPAGAAKPAATAAASKPAAAAAAVSSDPSKPPPGLSMMEEMKWRQAQKAKEPPKAFVEPVKKPDDKPAVAKAPAAPGPNDKPPPGLSMMEEMKWKQAQKAAIAAAGGGPSPIKEPPKKAPASTASPAFAVALKSSPGAIKTTTTTTTAGGAQNKPPLAATGTAKPGAIPTKAPTTPAPPAWNKPPAKAVVQAATNLAAAPPPPNVDALVALLVGAKISPDNAKKYATALAQEGFDAPDKLALLDEGDLTACGITARFDIKTIISLKNNLPKTPAPAAASSTPAKPGAAASSTTAKPGAIPAAAPAKPGMGAPASTVSKPGVPAMNGAPKPATSAPTAAPASAKPGFPATSGGAAAKPAIGGAAAKPSGPSIPASSGPVGFQVGKPALKSGANEQAKRDAERLAFVLALGAPMDSYKKPKQIG